MLAASRGMAVSYLGPDVPARVLVESVNVSGAQVLVLAFTLTRDTSARTKELRAIIRGLPRNVELWAAGPGTVPPALQLGQRGLVLDDLETFLAQVTRLADRPAQAKRRLSDLSSM
jgi:predicted ATPase